MSSPRQCCSHVAGGGDSDRVWIPSSGLFGHLATSKYLEHRGSAGGCSGPFDGANRTGRPNVGTQGESVRENKVWTLVVLAGLAALTLVRSERELDAADLRPVRASSDINPIVLGSPADAASPSFQSGSSWLLFRADWAAVLWRVYQKMNDNRLLAVAAGVVFYGLLAVFPAITAFVSLYGLLADPSTLHERLSTAAGILPQGALNILNEQLTRLTSHRSSTLSAGFVGGFLVALWSANAGVKAVMDALNVAYDETEKRSFVYLNLIALVFTLGAIFSLDARFGRGGGNPSRALAAWIERPE